MLLLVASKKVVLQHEVSQLVRHEVEQVHPWSNHQLLTDRVLGGLHPDAGALAVQLDQDHSEVGPTEVEGKVSTMLSTGRKLRKCQFKFTKSYLGT